MVKTMAKRGRPTAVYKTSWGEQVPGLFQLTDGRWRVTGPGKTTFSEKDERLAIARFHSIVAQRNAPPKIIESIGKFSSVKEGFAAATMVGTGGLIHYGRTDAPGGVEVSVAKSYDTPNYWQWLRKRLIDDPKWVSERVGLDLVNVKVPPKSEKLSALIDVYCAKNKLSPNELSRSKLHWAEFVKAVAVERVNQIDHAAVGRYETFILDSKLSPKSQHHRFAKVKTIFAFGMRRGIEIAACRAALDCLAMLQIKLPHAIDPQPIKPAEFWAIYIQAVKAEDQTFAAMMLTSLNFALYAGEASALKWAELDLKAGVLVTRRPKTGVSRVGVAWPETIKALKALPRQGDYVFYTSVRSYTVFSALASWRKYREAAKLGEEVVFSQIRDAAFTIACQHSTLDQARVLAGHKLPGSTDAYLRRNPQMVADACREIHKALGVAKHASR